MSSRTAVAASRLRTICAPSNATAQEPLRFDHGCTGEAHWFEVPRLGDRLRDCFCGPTACAFGAKMALGITRHRVR